MRHAQVAILAMAASGYCQTPTATISAGAVEGFATGLPNAENSVNAYLGIPYASIPQRFSRAEDAEPWNETLKGTSFGPSCPQNFAMNPIGPSPEVIEGLFKAAKPVEDEDCLNLNVFAPAAAPPEQGHPVVVFIPGGGFQLGNNQNNLTAFAAYEDVVAVNLNWRTNVFGFPYSPEIPITERNLGLYDQRLALDWVQDNIAAFGGDPDKVTVWGQSAGSISVDWHLKAYADAEEEEEGEEEEKDLPFRAAILSDGQSSFGYLALLNPTEGSWDVLAEAAGCGGDEGRDGDGDGNGAEQLECLRRVPWRELRDVVSEAQLGFSPVVDNVTVLSGPAELWRSGRAARVPLLTGTAAEEGRMLVNTEVNMTMFFEAYFPEALVPAEQREAIVSVYEADPELETDFDVAAAILTDFNWQCAIHANQSASNTGPSSTWRYYWNASIPEFIPDEFSWLGKFHGSETWLLFTEPSEANYTAQTYTLFENFRGALGRFVRDPDAGPGWPAVGSEFGPADVGVWGDLGGEKTGGVTAVDHGVVDERCKLYEDIYPLIEMMVG